MAWLNIYSGTFNVESQEYDYAPINVPLKRIINLNNLPKKISAGEQIYVNLKDKYVNKYFNTSLQESTDNSSYLVVYEDYADDQYFVPVSSTISADNILYFTAEEDIEKNIFTNKYYAIYYGLSNIKYIYSTTDENNNTIYVRDTESALAFNLSVVSDYTFTATTTTEEYGLAFHNSGTDWLDGRSVAVGAKAFGVFDGPSFKLIGSTGRSYGKFKISIYPYTDQNNISTTAVVDSVEVDCYSGTDQINQILYEKIDLDYKKYIFEIQTLFEKNIMASDNSVSISNYMFTPNYQLIYDTETINPSLSFIKINGVR